jgi:dihydropteroate synthase
MHFSLQSLHYQEIYQGLLSFKIHGIGFGKNTKQNYEVIRKLRELKSLGVPLMVGTSRKEMIGKVLNLPPNERVEGTAATIAVSIMNGADIVRVHDVKEMKRVAMVTDEISKKY